MIARFDKATILNSAVSRINFALQGKLEILDRSAFPNQESISLGWILLGIDPNDGSILHTPVKGVAIPALQGLPIKESLITPKRQDAKEGSEEIKDTFHELKKSIIPCM